MKKLFRRVLPLILATAMLLSVAAYAAPEGFVKDGENDKGTLYINGGISGTVTAKFSTANPDIMEVTYSGGMLVEGEQYLVLMYTGDSIGQDTIKYINQGAATLVGGTPSITFNVYPSEFHAGSIIIAGVDEDGTPGSILAVVLEAKYVLGDVDNKGGVTATDAAIVLRYVAKMITFDSAQLSAADVDGKAGVTASDAAKLLRVVAKMETLQ